MWLWHAAERALLDIYFEVNLTRSGGISKDCQRPFLKYKFPVGMSAPRSEWFNHHTEAGETIPP
jgi:hypothetical protein